MTEPATTPARHLPAASPGVATGWDRLGALLLPATALVLYPLFLGDRVALHMLQILVWAALAVLALGDREPPVRFRLARTAVLFAGVALFAVMVGLYANAPGATWINSLKYEVWLILALDIWLLTGIPHSRTRARAQNASAAAAFLLLAFAAWSLASATGSADPKNPMKLWGAEIGVYLGIFVVAVRQLASPHRGEAAARRCVWVVTLAALGAMLAVVAVHAAGGAPAQWLRANEWIRTEAADPSAPWRLQFPFGHHNRAAFFALCAAGILGAEFAAGRFNRAASAVGIAMAAVAIAFTVTRGALLAGVAGVVVLLAGLLATAAPRKRWFVPLLALPLLWFVLPEAHRGQIRQVFSAKSYTPGPGTSIGARIELWQLTGRIIAGHPLLGIGYGHDTFEAYTTAHDPQTTKRLDGMSHAHNQWLAVSAESGIPAALILAAFTALRMGWLGIAWNAARRRRDPIAAVLLVWLALEVAIQAYAMTNHVMRRNIGMFTYVIWALSCVLARRAGAGRVSASRPPG